MSCQTPPHHEVCDTVLRAVSDAVRCTFEAMYGCQATQTEDSGPDPNVPSVAGIIGFVGDRTFTLCWSLPQGTAERLAAHMLGDETIQFDSDETADVAGELVNILAGDVVAKLDGAGLKVQMSLPTIVRGTALQLFPNEPESVAYLHFDSAEGPFSIRLTFGERQGLRMPGA